MSDHGWESVIGLEVHVQLGVHSKLFSSAPAAFGGEPNTRVAAYDLGLPGVLPVLNDRAVDLAIRAALALGGKVQEHSRFDRKNYFYPDLPKGYQISQFDRPYCVGGTVPLGDGRTAALTRIHLEEDAGKSTHVEIGTLIDLNRAGTALVEIVGEPDLHTPRDAALWLENLKLILQYAGVSDCDMERGSLRCDANISLRRAGTDELRDKVEIKNLNSFKMVERALEYEIRRQTVTLEAGGRVVQETRLWNDEIGETKSMRSKEDAQDYRYVPDPDLPPLVITKSRVERVHRELPELPDARRSRFRQALGLPDYDVGVLTADPRIADWFEGLVEAGIAPKPASNWVMTEVLRTCGEQGVTIDDFAMPQARLADLIRAQETGKVNMQAARKAFVHMLEHGGEAAATISELGLEQISDEGALASIVDEVLGEMPKAVEDVRAGKAKALHALKGKVMAKTRGKADPVVAERLLREKIDS